MDSNLYEYIELIKRLSPQTVNLVTAESNEEFDNAFDSWLEYGIAQLERNSRNYQALDEEGISAVLTAVLTTPEVMVKQEENSNGHVDLTVELRNPTNHIIKLGEAKIWRGQEYHVKGLDQLLNRYTTGRECRGFVISYVKLKDIRDLFEKLRKHMDESEPFDLEGLCEDHNIKWSFLSNHKHNSGELIAICHIGCNLFIESK